MLSRRMPFPRVACEIYVPTLEEDDFGNEVPDYDVEPIETECSYAPGTRAAQTEDDFDVDRPMGDRLTVTFFLPKTLDADLRGAIIAVDSGDSMAGIEFHVVGDPHSYMREATPGDMSWCVEAVANLG